MRHINSLLRSASLRSVSAILRTNVLIQAISFFAVPILSRIYGPENYGAFALYVTLLAYLTNCAFLRYDVAIDIPEHEGEAQSLFKLCVVLAAALLAAVTLVILLWRAAIADLFEQPVLADLLLLMPISLAIACAGSLFSHWFGRLQQFEPISNFRLAAAMSDAGSKYLLGSAGLLKLGQVLGSIISGTVLLALAWRHTRRQTSAPIGQFDIMDAFKVGWRYRRFPILGLPGMALEMTAQAVPTVLVAFFFGPAAAGVFYVADRLTQAPAAAISGAIRPVFKRRAALALHETTSCRPLMLRTLLATVPIGLGFGIAIFVVAAPFFQLLFDSRWLPAIQLAQILAVSRALDVMVNPITPVFLVRQSLWTNLALQALYLTTTIAAFLIGGAQQDIALATILFSVGAAVKYCLELIFCYARA